VTAFASQRPNQSEPPAPERNPVLLFIGSDFVALESLRREITQPRLGRYRLRVASTLEAARTGSREAAPEVVLLDLNLPGSQGLDVLLQVRAIFRGSAIVALAERESAEIGLHALGHGAHDYLAKNEIGNLLSRSIRYALERRAAERERELYEAQLAEAERLQALGRLTAGVAHEINTPVQFISDNLTFLRRGIAMLTVPLGIARRVTLPTASPADGESLLGELAAALQVSKLDYVERHAPLAIAEALDGLDRIARFVAALQQFDRPKDTHHVPTDLERILDTSLRVTQNAWREVANVQTEYASALPLIAADPGELTQVFVNLIINAADALGARQRNGKGTITLGTRRVPDGLEAWVADNGIGIPPSDIPRIFEPFFTTKPIGTALGRGLAVAQRIVRGAHGGNIHVDSLPGTGTTFVVSLPLSAAL
jgi:two-component system NtrC family sensor kinase